MEDIQLGVGCPSGIDKIAQLLKHSRFFYPMASPPSTTWIKLYLYPISLLLMGMVSNLCVFGDDGKSHKVACETGVQQGQVQGPLLYGITTYAFFKGIQDVLAVSPEPGNFIKAYLDDGTIMCTTAQLLEVLAYKGPSMDFP
jgi:hypothetical protein